MARTKSSENENSDDEVILRVKKKSVTGSDLKKMINMIIYYIKIKMKNNNHQNQHHQLHK